MRAQKYEVGDMQRLESGRGQGSGGRPLASRVGETGYLVSGTKSISLEVRLVGMVDDNILIESIGDARTFDFGVPHEPPILWTPPC